MFNSFNTSEPDEVIVLKQHQNSRTHKNDVDILGHCTSAGIADDCRQMYIYTIDCRIVGKKYQTCIISTVTMLSFLLFHLMFIHWSVFVSCSFLVSHLLTTFSWQCNDFPCFVFVLQ